MIKLTDHEIADVPVKREREGSYTRIYTHRLIINLFIPIHISSHTIPMHEWL